MRVFNVTIKNCLEWYSEGKVELNVVILSEDMTDALVRSYGVCERLREKLNGKFDAETIRPVRIEETCPNVDEGIGFTDSSTIEEALEKIARQAKK